MKLKHGIEKLNDYLHWLDNNEAPRSTSASLPAYNKIAARTGPTHGVQPKAKASPTT